MLNYLPIISYKFQLVIVYLVLTKANTVYQGNR